MKSLLILSAGLLIASCASINDLGYAPSSAGYKQRQALNWGAGPGVPIIPEGSDKHECGLFGARELVSLENGKTVIRCKEITLKQLIYIGR